MSLNNEEKIRELMEKSSRPLIVISKNPSGDMISSALALFWVLKKAEKKPQIICLNKISQKFSFLTGYDLIEKKNIVEFKTETDLIFTIGKIDSKPFRKMYPNLPIVNIDYRNSSDRVSVSEVVAKLIETAPFLEIDNETANLLLVGIIEKTDNLRSVHADSEVACLAKYLLHLGARRNEIVKYLRLKENISKSKQTLIAVLLFVTTGIFLFQLSVFLPQFAKNNYNLKSQQVVKNDSQMPIVNSKKTENEDFFGVFSNDDNNIANNTTTVATAISKNSATGIIENKELPQKLEIPKLGINTRIQDVGLDANQKMKTPSNNTDVAWFNLGPKPGEIGSAVIVGHLDTKSSQPAVFWDLHKLKAGDDVFVIDGENNKKRFQVIFSEKYGTETAPMEKIFGADDGIYLNLITCGGVWDKAKNNYSERVVVFTEYVF
ncbi:MAG: sortase [Candidatus Pacebacteria bacterium]|nr:sortase [Candidatus Paceibacterota bacterium]